MYALTDEIADRSSVEDRIIEDKLFSALPEILLAVAEDAKVIDIYGKTSERTIIWGQARKNYFCFLPWLSSCRPTRPAACSPRSTKEQFLKIGEQ
jgi:hypothetical protein